MNSEKVENGTCLENKENYKSDNGADFEKAVSETKFGLFNIILFLVTITSILASQFEISSLSFVFPAAQCDLNLSLESKGLLNAIIYIGMIGSCFIWGSLADIFGRRKILIISHLLDCIFVLTAAFAPNFTVLIVAKFFGGFLINGPAMALTPYLSEFHATQYRSRVPLTIGLIYNMGNIIIPLVAWAVLPLNIKFNIFDTLEFHAWNLFILISIVPSLSSGICFATLPESPKYLMSKGNNDKALEIFQKVFKFNTKQAREEYPIKQLKDERQIEEKKTTLKDAWKQISPLFSLQYATKLILVCSLIFLWMMTVNSFRLWLPEIFQLINDYESNGNETTSICKILSTVGSVVVDDADTCSVNFDNASVYINSVIVAFSAVSGYIVAALCVNRIGKKRMLISLGLLSGASIVSVYFTTDFITPIVLISIFMTCSCICVDVIITVIVDLFPTYLRASALSMALMCGRIGSVLGNLTFPLLLQTGCASVFFTLGSAAMVSTILALFLPKTDFTALQ